MRYSCGFMLILIMAAVLSTGCLQSPAPPATPPPATPIPLQTTVTLQDRHKEVNVTTWKTDKNVIVRYNGGRDAALLTMFRVQIDNQDGKNIKTPVYTPEVGREYEFPYVGIPNPRTINIVGVFSDGTEQTLLIYYF